MSAIKTCSRCSNRVAAHVQQCRQCGNNAFRTENGIETNPITPAASAPPAPAAPDSSPAVVREVAYQSQLGEVQTFYLSAIANFVGAAAVSIIGGPLLSWFIFATISDDGSGNFFTFVGGVLGIALLVATVYYISKGFQALRAGNDSLD